MFFDNIQEEQEVSRKDAVGKQRWAKWTNFWTVVR